MPRARLTVLSVLFAAFWLVVLSEAEAKSRFDGSWVLFISGATPGSCEFGFRVSVRVRNGLVSWHGLAISRSMIGISSGGSVAIRLTDGRNVVTGNGAIGQKFGTGRWSAPAFRCAGRWSAARR